MTVMKRTLSLLLSVVCLLVCLSGCEESSNESSASTNSAPSQSVTTRNDIPQPIVNWVKRSAVISHDAGGFSVHGDIYWTQNDDGRWGLLVNYRLENMLHSEEQDVVIALNDDGSPAGSTTAKESGQTRLSTQTTYAISVANGEMTYAEADEQLANIGVYRMSDVDFVIAMHDMGIDDINVCRG